MLVALTEPIWVAVMLPEIVPALTEPIWLAVMVPTMLVALTEPIWPAEIEPTMLPALTEPIWPATTVPVIDENEIDPTEKYWVQVIGVTPIVIVPVVVMTKDVLEFVAPESTKT